MSAVGDRPLGPCQALTRAGERCTRSADYPVPIGDRVVPLCGLHARHARMGTVGVWDPDRPPVEPAASGSRWTEEDDAYVTASRGLPIILIAQHLGRSVHAVTLRRRLLDLRAEEDTP